jgi:hypothetical protein
MYGTSEELVSDLRMVQSSLAEAGAVREAYGSMLRLIWQVETFGFGMVEMEIRQHSLVHARALEDLRQNGPEGQLQPMTHEVLPTLRAMSLIQRRNGRDACRRYIISFTQSARDVATVYELAHYAFPNAEELPDIDVIPLFEQLNDLENAVNVLDDMLQNAPDDIKGQLADNLHWILEAGKNHLVVGSQARILYADAEGRTRIALAFNDAIRRGEISRPVVLGRDHHDVSGTDSPFRETSNIYDGSQFCADMAVQNVIGDSFRGATWVSIHNGGGVGWGEVINGGFGMVIDGSEESDRKIREMLFWDVNNGIARRSWARNKGSIDAIKREMERTPGLRVTLPNIVDDEIINNL